mmetsp:Transcript_90645/g.293430  ORF Transcript_90645/g.293430 Transcript_90645/m.293430 type:complete len:239 (+) Transcript_90645:371-1087(+)
MTKRESAMSTDSSSKEVAAKSSADTSRGRATRSAASARLYSMMPRSAFVRRKRQSLDLFRSSTDKFALKVTWLRRPSEACLLVLDGNRGKKSNTNMMGSSKEGRNTTITGVNSNSNGLKPRSKVLQSSVPRCSRGPRPTRPNWMCNCRSRPRAKSLLESATILTRRAPASTARTRRKSSAVPDAATAQSRGRPLASRQSLLRRPGLVAELAAGLGNELRAATVAEHNGRGFDRDRYRS